GHAARLRRRVLRPRQGGVPANAAAAALLPSFVPAQFIRLAPNDGQQEVPHIVAVVELGKVAGLGPAAEAVEGAEGHVLLVCGAARRSAEPLPGKADQAVGVTLPELRRGRVVAGLEAGEPLRNAGKMLVHG